jgi:hypothetical protein
MTKGDLQDHYIGTKETHKNITLWKRLLCAAVERLSELDC